MEAQPPGVIEGNEHRGPVAAVAGGQPLPVSMLTWRRRLGVGSVERVTPASQVERGSSAAKHNTRRRVKAVDIGFALDPDRHAVDQHMRYSSR
jgi:hypothetical protein